MPTPRTRLVGREDELRALAAWFDRARDREPAVVAITGDAGIGKTALVRAFAETLGDDVLVVRGASHEGGGSARPWAPLVHVVSRLVEELGVGRVLELAGRSRAELGRLVSLPMDEPPPRPSDTGHGRLIEAVTGLLRGVAGGRPLLLVLEDLHWSDTSTLELLPPVVHALDDRRAMVAMTLRWDELPDGAPARRLAAELVRGERGQLIELGPLSRSEQARQLAAILGVPPTRERLDRIWSRAAGNPFFAEELVVHDGADLPRTVNELLLGRLVDLPPGSRRLLTTVAVTGRGVEPDLLGAVLDLDETGLRAALEPAVQAHVLVPDDDGHRLVFRHALLAEVAARMVLPTEADGLHDRIADALDRGLGPDDVTERGQALARHRVAAGDVPRALPAMVQAAQQARAVLAHPAAHRHYEDALGLWDQVEDAPGLVGVSHQELLREAAEVAHLAGRFGRAAEFAQAALTEMDADQDPVAVGLAHERLGRYLWMAADGVRAMRCYERALQLVPVEPATRARARVLSGQSQVLAMAGDFTHALDLARQAVAMARVLDARRVEGHALNNRGVSRAYLGEVDEGLADLTRAGRIAEQFGDDVDEVLRTIVNRTAVLHDSGRIAEAADFALAHRKGVWSRCEAAFALLELGRLERARELVAEAGEYRPVGIEAAVAKAVTGRLERLVGRLDRATQALETAADQIRHVVDGQLVGRLATDRVRVEVALGRPGAGIQHAHRAWRRLAHPEAAHVAPLAAAAVEAAVDAVLAGDGDRRVVDDWLDRCATVVGADPATKPAPRAWLGTARADRTRLDGGDPGAWAQAVEAWERLGARPEAARARWRLGGAILDRDGDRDRAARLLRSAHDDAGQMGLDGLRSQVAELVRRARLDVEVADGRDPRSSLTPRERDVLELLTAGQTNRAIADRLFIGHRTVATHVSNILAKLSATTRSEAAAIAVRDGLVD